MSEAAVTVVNRLKPARWRRVLRWVVWGALALVLLPVLLLTLGLAWLDSDAGKAWLLGQINRSGVLRVERIDGSFWSQFDLSGVRVETGSETLAVDHARMKWVPYTLLLRRLDIENLQLGTLSYQAKPLPPAKPASPPPQSLTLPFTLQIDQFSLAQFRSGKETLFSGLSGSLSSSGRQHQLNLKNLTLPQGDITGVANLDGRQPFQLNSRLVFDGKVEGRAVKGHVRADGPLRKLGLALQVDGEDLRASAGLTIDAFAEHGYQILKAGQVELRGINPQAFAATLPSARLDVHLRLTPQGPGRAVGDLAVKNADAGTLDAGKIPVKNLNTQLEYANEALHLKRLHLDTLGSGRITGDAGLTAGAMKLTLGIADLDPASLWSRQPRAALSGELQLDGPWLAPDIKLDIRDRLRKVEARTDLGWIHPERERRIEVRSLLLQQGKSLINAKGSVALEKKYDFSLEAEFKDFNPSDWAAVPAGQIAGMIKADGQIEPSPQATIEYRLQASRFNGSALAGEGRLQLQADRLQQADAWLSLGSNRLGAKGALGNPADQLLLDLDLPALQQLGPGFSGRIAGTVNLQGQWRNPRTTLQLEAAGLAAPGGVRIAQARLAGSLQPDLNSPFDLNARLAGVEAGANRLDQLDLAINGTRAQHAGTLQASMNYAGAPASVQAGFSGGLDAQWVWQGQLAKLDGEWRQPIHLAAPVPLKVGAGQAHIGALNLAYGRSQLNMAYFNWDGQSWESSGQLPQLHAGELLALLPQKSLSGDLQLGAQWQLAYRNVLNGSLTVERQRGDLVWRSATPGSKAEPLRLEAAKLSLRSDASKLALSGMLQSAFGQAELRGQATFDPATGIATAAPLQLGVQGRIPDLAPLAALAGGDLRLNGQLQFDITRSGTLQAASYAGHVNGKQLAVSDPALGVQLREGVMDLQLADRKIQLSKLHFQGGKGTLDGAGVIALDAADQLAATAELKLNQFTLVSKADMLLVASGQGQIRVADGTLQINGAFKADQGDIQYVDNEVPKLSDDVVIVGRAPKQEGNLMKMALQLDLDLGKDFRVRGYGLDATLAGQLRLRAQPGKPLAGSGTLSVEEGGQFRAYGQKLDIDRGILSFQGPLDNPGLDILAVRRNQQVEAGVKVTGSARSPRVSLYSEPTVSDTEKLSWLMFGHGSDSMDKSDSALLLQMLNSMAGDGLGKGLTDEILDKVGIDEVGYRTEKNEDGTSTQIVSVSKQLNRNLRMSLEKSIDGLSDAVKFSFNLTRGWSLVTRIGFDKSSVDAYYSFSFD
ncbi:translocation/assembly module TamB domain-containing protein [Chitinilyticum aquatile]|uniref:translocation/assembly module TamB domain-containing protein n=1 Tax=Chitinilyticum aquatile TaxID=362520 RepID=UPI0003FE5420|nr:translocation/assembly module TamB domain-containing protein [Chitinilyticum aquatile]